MTDHAPIAHLQRTRSSVDARTTAIHDVIAVKSFSAWCANRIRSNWPSAKGGASVHNNALVTEALHANPSVIPASLLLTSFYIVVLIFHFDTRIIYFYSPIDLLRTRS